MLGIEYHHNHCQDVFRIMIKNPDHNQGRCLIMMVMVWSFILVLGFYFVDKFEMGLQNLTMKFSRLLVKSNKVLSEIISVKY